jgi:hypothetical protein
MGVNLGRSPQNKENKLKFSGNMMLTRKYQEVEKFYDKGVSKFVLFIRYY